MAMVSVIWVVVAFVVGVLVASLLAWLLWQDRAAQLEEEVRSARADLDRRIHLLQQQEVTIEQLESRIRQGETRQRDLQSQVTEYRASAERLRVRLAQDGELLGERAPSVPPVAVTAEDPLPARSDSGQSQNAPQEKESDEGKDDLKRVEGIGPKISAILHQAGIHTFDALAEAEVGQLARIVREAGVRVVDPTTWPQQASLAAQARWDELDDLQNRLQGGRVVSA